jgi:hypothetical protein
MGNKTKKNSIIKFLLIKSKKESERKKEKTNKIRNIREVIKRENVIIINNNPNLSFFSNPFKNLDNA